MTVEAPLVPRRWVPAVVDDDVPGYLDLLGRPGVLTSVTMMYPDGAQKTAYSACCPGCGTFVAALMPESWEIIGNRDKLSMTSRTPMEWECCGWTGFLRRGAWRFSLRGLPRYLSHRLG